MTFSTTLLFMQTEEVPPASHILVVEDDAGTRALLLRFLRENGYSTTGARNGTEMWEALQRLPVDLIILDIMLPGRTGLDLCRDVRRERSVPIIMVTARASEIDRVLGLELGADDYVPKPFSRPELLARIRAVLRRSKANTDEAPVLRSRRLGFAGYQLDMGRRELTAPGGEAIELSAAEYDVLMAFLEHPQRVLTRDRLLELSRSRVGDVFDRSVDVLISRLRRKLDLAEGGTDIPKGELIKTMRGVGYIFVADVTRG
jgi:two-component system OmpR family response regulator